MKDKLILAISSDIHIHDWTEYSEYDKNGIPSRLKQYNQLAQDFFKFSNSIGADINILAGDISESANQSPMVLNALRNFLETVSQTTPTIVTHGQHDIATKDNLSPKEHSILTSLSSEIKKLHYYPKQSELLKSEDFCSKAGFTLKVSPWDNDSSIPEEAADVFVGHGMVQNCQNLEGYRFKSGFKSEELYKKFRLSIIGDIHNGQVFVNDDQPRITFSEENISDSNRKILLPGSPIQNSWKDAANCGFWKAEISEDNIELKFYNIHSLNPNTYHQFLFCEESHIKKSTPLVHYRIRGSFKGKGKATNSEVKIDVSQNLLLELSRRILSKEKFENPTLVDKLLEETIEACSNKDLSKVIPNCKLVSISCENFLSIKNFNLNFDEFHKQVVMIGDTGSGKTSVTEAVFWCISGNTTKGVSSNEVINTKLQKDATVELILEINGQSYKISRKRLMTGNPSLFISVLEGDSWVSFNKSSVKDTQDSVYKLIGITDKEIKILSYFSAKNTLLFNNLTSAEKSNIISKVIGTGDMDSLKEYAKIKKNEITTKVNTLNGSILTSNQALSRNKTKLADLSKVTDYGADIVRIDGEINTLKSLIIDTSKASERIKEIQPEINKISTEIRDTETKIREISNDNSKVDATLLDLTAKLKKNLESGECYACSQKLVDTKLKDQLVTAITEAKEKKKLIPSDIEFKNKLESLNQEHVSLSKELSSLNNQMVTNDANSRKILTLQTQKDSLKSTQSDPALMDHVLSEIKELEKDMDIKSIELESYEKENFIWNFFFSKLFKKDGELSELLNEQAIIYIQKEIDSLLDESGLSVTLERDLSLKAKFFGEYRDYFALSNGQSRVCDVVVMVALNNIFSKLHNLENGVLGLIIFDEILSFLSKEYIDICKSILDQLIVEKTIIITHDTRLISLFDSKINVTMVNDLSEYKFNL